MKKIVVQCSGGIESTVLLAKAIAEVGRENTYAIAFDTDSIFWRHRDAVAVKRVVTNLQIQQNLFVCRMPQMDYLEYVRNEQYADVGFIPGFKMLFNVASLAYAQRVGASRVWIGNMGDNVFPDESSEFIDDTNTLYNRTYSMETNQKVYVQTPFAGLTKAEVIQYGHSINVDLADTVSCGDERLAGGFNCGSLTCPWCQKRKQGFLESGVIDKTQYMFDNAPYVRR